MYVPSPFLCTSNSLRNHFRHCAGQHLQDAQPPGSRNSQQSDSSFQPLQLRKWGIWLLFTAGSQPPSNSLIFLLCFIACAASSHTSLAPNFLLPRLLSSHSPSLLPSDSALFPSQPSLIQQIYSKHLLSWNTASCFLSLCNPPIPIFLPEHSSPLDSQ